MHVSVKQAQNYKSVIARAQENQIVIPTFAQMKNPEKVPEAIQRQLKKTGLWDIKPCNLFRITWKNEPKSRGGLFGGVNFIEFPPELTGVKARILALNSKWFPVGCHKVGAAFSCLVPRLLEGQFNPSYHKTVWPSTGNFCRGGAYISSLLSCESVAILPVEMSRERFGWLSTIASEVVTIEGQDGNMLKLFQKANELQSTRPNIVVFDQFAEAGNYMWHYHVTGDAIQSAYESIKTKHSRLAGICLSVGSGGAMASGDYIKRLHPEVKLAAGEVSCCATLMNNGFSPHHIEGIGHRHVPWIMNIRNLDMSIGVEDDDCIGLYRLFNEPVGCNYLRKRVGVPVEFVEQLSLLGLSGISNFLCAIKMAKYYELDENDVIVTVLTDSADMYLSRIEEFARKTGEYTPTMASNDYHRHLQTVRTDNMQEFNFQDRKRIHNLKYFTWVEQKGKAVDELSDQWAQCRTYWKNMQDQVVSLDEKIQEFNEDTGVLKSLRNL